RAQGLCSGSSRTHVEEGTWLNAETAVRATATADQTTERKAKTKRGSIRMGGSPGNSAASVSRNSVEIPAGMPVWQGFERCGGRGRSDNLLAPEQCSGRHCSFQ